MNRNKINTNEIANRGIDLNESKRIKIKFEQHKYKTDNTKNKQQINLCLKFENSKPVTEINR